MTPLSALISTYYPCLQPDSFGRMVAFCTSTGIGHAAELSTQAPLKTIRQTEAFPTRLSIRENSE